jgi:hypothetical protein
MVTYTKSWRRTSSDGKWRCKSITVEEDKVHEVWESIGGELSDALPQDKSSKDDKAKGRRSKGSKSQSSKGAKVAKGKQVKKQLAGKTTKSK